MKDVLIDWSLNQNLKYGSSNSEKVSLKVKEWTIAKGVKNWSFDASSPIILALFSNEEDNLNNILKAFGGFGNIIFGQIILNEEDVTYNFPGWERQIAYLASNQFQWNKLFSVRHNLIKTAKSVRPFLQAIGRNNTKVKIDIASLKNTGRNLNRAEFKARVIKLIKAFINETQTSRNLFIKEYETQINEFHERFAKNKFNFPGGEELAEVLIRKLNAEEENMIVNNNLLFYQSLQDRISSLENLVGDCICGCEPPKKRKKEFELNEMPFIIDEINSYLEDKIFLTRKQIRTTLKSCNNHNQIFSNELNQALAYKKINLSRTQVDQIIEEWVDLAEVQRIKFNMKQDFIAMQLLPDEMQLLLKNIRHEIEIYHKKLLDHQKFEDASVYHQELKDLEDKLIDFRDLIDDNISLIFEELQLTSLLKRRYSDLSLLERRIVKVIQKLVVVNKVLLLENPFYLLERSDKVKLAKWLKILAKKLSIIIIFSSKSNEEISLVASHLAVIENGLVVQQGKIGEISAKPLSLNLLKEMNKRGLNVFLGQWYPPTLSFYNKQIAIFPNLKNAPIIALKASDIIFSYRKPLFTFFSKVIKISGTIKEVNKINERQSLLTFKTFDDNLFEVLVYNYNNFKIGSKGWISIVKNTIYIFDSENKQLIGTW
ncbi:hypothetical protein [Spiroplasma platyhelix]|uniref:ABC transporter domain-containing protein n=1 Tax=Spiroplasma platyhelix PALS-1 TaxID=1276218 RepID=A0A846U555_9MOLU|nr:hypothetical protein [Spiroplasma platyhelix]MBE4704214.1 hypothetical protein [Spiroplasma platyhelix PALS-1]NKE38587.1 hypothetical protein [Spiroplasma platyhelix PALS-1]UJB28798.1 hypothetical protein SPLAT_v1c00310 [Spiroplasma platyhelix PALS-1]